MKRYLLVFSVVTLAVCVAVGWFNYRVDAYGIYRVEDASEARLSRIDQFYHLRLTKPWIVAQIKPSAIITGTSRSAALHPRHPLWPEGRSYNSSIPGQTIYEMLRFIEHAQANGPLDKLMIGLDFEAFIQPEPRFKLGFEESRLARDSSDIQSPAFFWRRLNDIRDTLFSLGALDRSLSALTGTSKVGNSYHADGAWYSKRHKLLGQTGYIMYGKSSVLGPAAQQLDVQETLDIFAEILRFAHRNRIDTRLFITPEHLFVIDLWARMGKLALWHEFHRGLVAVNTAVAEEMGVAPFPLFGFNHVRGVIDEPIRPAMQAGQSTFTDGVHFSPALGERIMAGVWTDGSGVGVRLDAASIDGYLSDVDRLRDRFERDNTDVTARLRRGISPALE